MDYRTHITASPAEIDATQWNALLATQERPTPFLRHEFLTALSDTGCANAQSGWAPQFVTLWASGADGETLVAAAPFYVKSHSYGEYVFDWAWADAYRRHGLPYYPKLLCAVPFTPVTGPRLMARDARWRAELARVLVALAERAEMSSLHVLFPDPVETEALQQAGLMMREGVQFHWLNPGYADFDAFLATLEQKKRKNIRAERRRVREAGVSCRRVRGEEASAADWQFFNRCYRNTYREHHSTPYLNLEFFQRLGREMPENLLLVIAERDGQAIASSLTVYQRGTRADAAPHAPAGTLYGRYWGALEHVPCLHFEVSYYQPLEFCIAERLAVFEGGAQGEHKMARGFMPTVTRSLHWLAHPAFSDAVADFLARERAGIDDYVDELREHSPFRHGAQDPD